MNNNTKNSFSASLNGKVYNNRKEFLNAIRSTKNNQIKDIRINETIEENIPNPNPEENTSAQKVNLEQLDNLTSLLSLFGITPEMIDAATKSFAQRFTDESESGPVVREPNAVEIARANMQKKFDEQMTYLTDHYIFLEYQNVKFNNGDKADEYFLDMTSKKMYSLLGEFKNTVVRYSPKVLVEFRKMVERERDNVHQYYTAKKATLKELQTNIHNLKLLENLANRYGYKLVSSETGVENITNRIENRNSDEKENTKRLELGELLCGYYNQLLSYFNA